MLHIWYSICSNQTCILLNRGVYDFCLEKAKENTFEAGPRFPDHLSFLLYSLSLSLGVCSCGHITLFTFVALCVRLCSFSFLVDLFALQ